jgi:hypothetical protein
MSMITLMTALILGTAAAAQVPGAAGLGEMLRTLAAGQAPMHDVRFETQCVEGGRFVHARAYGNGVVIWDDMRQATVAREQVILLLKMFDREGFAAMPASFGGNEDLGARMAPKMTCRVRFSAGGAAKDVIQLEKGEQSAALARLAHAIVDAARAATRGVEPIASLQDGLARIAAGELAVETMRITLRVGTGTRGRETNSRGWVFRIDGRDAEIDPDGEQKTTWQLDEASIRNAARALADGSFPSFPMNLAAAEYVDLTVTVLEHEHSVQARQFAQRTAPDPAIQERFERAVATLRALARR